MRAADDGPRRSSRVRFQPTSYVPSHHGKKYLFAVTQLGQQLMKENEEEFTPEAMYCFMEQLSVNAAIKKWGKSAENAGKAEAAQLN